MHKYLEQRFRASRRSSTLYRSLDQYLSFIDLLTVVLGYKVLSYLEYLNQIVFFFFSYLVLFLFLILAVACASAGRSGERAQGSLLSRRGCW